MHRASDTLDGFVGSWHRRVDPFTRTSSQAAKVVGLTVVEEEERGSALHHQSQTEGGHVVQLFISVHARMAMNIFRLFGPCAPAHPVHPLTS